MGKGFRWASGAAVVATLVGGGVWATTRDDPPEPTFCGGVGLLTATRGFTPDEAMEAWLLERGWNPDDWKHVPGDDDGQRSYAYAPRAPENEPPRYATVLVEGAPSDYKVTGACVE